MNHLGSDSRVELQIRNEIAGHQRHRKERNESDPEDERDHVEQAANQEPGHRISGFLRRACENSVGLELYPLRFVQPPNRGLIVLERILPRRVALLSHGFDYRELIAKDLLNLPVVRWPLADIHFRRAFIKQRIDFGLPRRRRSRLIRIPDMQIARRTIKVRAVVRLDSARESYQYAVPIE